MSKPKEGDVREFKILRPDGSILWENGKFKEGFWLFADEYPKGWEDIFVEDGWYWFEIADNNQWSYVRKEKEGNFIVVADCSENNGIWYGINGDEEYPINGKNETDRRIKLLSFE